MSDIVVAYREYMQEGDSQPRYTPASVGARIRFLEQAERALPNGLDDVWPDDIKAFLRNPSWARWTRHTYDVHLRGFFRWAYEYGWLSCDPMEGMKPPPAGKPRPKPITADEVRLALERSADPWLTAIMLAVFAGLRASEIAALRREHVTEEYVHVLHGKGGKERYVDTSTVLWAYLRDRPAGPLVRRHDHTAVTGMWLSSRQQKHWRSIGLGHVHLHRLRHTFCTTMWQSGADPLVIRDEMGHASLSTTEGYAEPAAAQRRRAIDSLNGLGAPAGL